MHLLLAGNDTVPVSVWQSNGMRSTECYLDILVPSFVADRTLFQWWGMCLFRWTVGDGAEFEGEENCNEPVHYGRRKSRLQIQNFCRQTDIFFTMNVSVWFVKNLLIAHVRDRTDFMKAAFFPQCCFHKIYFVKPEQLYFFCLNIDVFCRHLLPYTGIRECHPFFQIQLVDKKGCSPVSNVHLLMSVLWISWCCLVVQQEGHLAGKMPKVLHEDTVFRPSWLN